MIADFMKDLILKERPEITREQLEAFENDVINSIKENYNETDRTWEDSPSPGLVSYWVYVTDDTIELFDAEYRLYDMLINKIRYKGIIPVAGTYRIARRDMFDPCYDDNAWG